MQIGGINLSELGAQLAPPPSTDTVLLLDADQHVYKAASTVKKLDTAIRRFYQLVLEDKFYTNAKTVRAYLTPSQNYKCGRFLLPTVKPYQEQRGSRQEIPLKGPLKDYLLAHPNEYAEHDIEIIFDPMQEADDLIIADSIEFGSRGLVSSFDKDMNLCRGPKWNPELGTVDTIEDAYGWFEYNKEKGKVVSHGTSFFWVQMLMGDSADNVKGILKLNDKNCGPKGAYDFLSEFKTEAEAANAVVRAYAEINQNFLAEAECLWLRRSADDSAFKYIHPLLEGDLQKWAEALHQYNEDYKAWQLSTQQ